MRLSAYFPMGDVRRDGDFSCIGLLYNRPAAEGMLTFAEGERYLSQLYAHPCVSAVITAPELAERILAQAPAMGVVVAADPKIALTRLHNALCETPEYAGSQLPTMIGEGCVISPLADIAAYNVVIGGGTHIGPFTCVQEHVTIGRDCRIGGHCVLGGQSLEVKRGRDGTMLTTVHCGKLVLGDRVELGQLNCVDRAVYPWDATVIGDDCRIGSMNHLAHCVKIGKRVIIPSAAVLLGTCTVEDDAYIGPNATVSNFVRVGKGARVSLGAVAVTDVPEGQTVSGNFALEHSRFLFEQRKLMK